MLHHHLLAVDADTDGKLCVDRLRELAQLVNIGLNIELGETDSLAAGDDGGSLG